LAILQASSYPRIHIVFDVIRFFCHNFNYNGNDKKTKYEWIDIHTNLYFPWNSLVDTKLSRQKFFFELSVNKKEISFYSYRQQWSYKVAAIEKIIKGYQEADTPSFPIFFVVRIEGESKTIEVFDNSDTFLQVYDGVQILKEICTYTGLKFETESGCSLLS